MNKQYFLVVTPVNSPVADQVLQQEPLTESQQALVNSKIEFNKRQTELVEDLIERCNVDVEIKKQIKCPYSATYYIFLIGSLDNLTYIATELEPFVESLTLDFKRI